MGKYIVELPEADSIACHELARLIANALVPEGQQDAGSPEERAGRVDPFAKNTPYPRSGALRQLSRRLREYRGAPYSPKWDPCMVMPTALRPRWLQAWADRSVDLQARLTQGELDVFSVSGRIKAQSIGPGTHVRRKDAIRYCLASGLDVAGMSTEPRLSMAPPPLAEPLVEPPAVPIVRADNVAAQPEVPVTPKPPSRFLRPKDAIARTGLARSTFYDWQDPHSRYFDATFPKPVKLGPRAIGYREDELDAWIASRPHKSR